MNSSSPAPLVFTCLCATMSVMMLLSAIAGAYVVLRAANRAGAPDKSSAALVCFGVSLMGVFGAEALVFNTIQVQGDSSGGGAALVFAIQHFFVAGAIISHTFFCWFRSGAIAKDVLPAWLATGLQMLIFVLIPTNQGLKCFSNLLYILYPQYSSLFAKQLDIHTIAMFLLVDVMDLVLTYAFMLRWRLAARDGDSFSIPLIICKYGITANLFSLTGTAFYFTQVFSHGQPPLESYFFGNFAATAATYFTFMLLNRRIHTLSTYNLSIVSLVPSSVKRENVRQPPGFQDSEVSAWVAPTREGSIDRSTVSINLSGSRRQTSSSASLGRFSLAERAPLRRGSHAATPHLEALERLGKQRPSLRGGGEEEVATRDGGLAGTMRRSWTWQAEVGATLTTPGTPGILKGSLSNSRASVSGITASHYGPLASRATSQNKPPRSDSFQTFQSLNPKKSVPSGGLAFKNKDVRSDFGFTSIGRSGRGSSRRINADGGHVAPRSMPSTPIPRRGTTKSSAPGNGFMERFQIFRPSDGSDSDDSESDTGAASRVGSTPHSVRSAAWSRRSKSTNMSFKSVKSVKCVKSTNTIKSVVSH
ncbi:hypothetical protein BC830DRAFT_899355 [Chytriomyces sp. MP71]|nr:hypothetical protein BC830DRAFT_899355 [Chytriomyces sp. MP71]